MNPETEYAKIKIMINIFKSAKTVVAEIHNEFDTAQERLLREAKNIIKENSGESQDKVHLLKMAGFVNSEAVKKYDSKNKLIVHNTEQANLIEHYKQSYPFQKFITEAELDRICKKYNLIYAPVANYEKDVPEKNLIDIRDCPFLKETDRASNLFFTIFTIWSTMVDREVKIPGNHPSSWRIKEVTGKYDDKILEKIKVVEIDRQSLFIAAPKSHFNLEGLQKEGFLNAPFSVTLIKPEDPIVFRYVRGGIQIITKWGLEASDPAVINEIEN